MHYILQLRLHKNRRCQLHTVIPINHKLIIIKSRRRIVCTHRFEGTDISGFDKGIYISCPGSPTPPFRATAKCDTNWFWVSYIRMCNTCIHEEGDSDHGRVDDNVWFVNVDASEPNAVAIRTAAIHGKWYVITGISNAPGTFITEGVIFFFSNSLLAL